MDSCLPNKSNRMHIRFFLISIFLFLTTAGMSQSRFEQAVDLLRGQAEYKNATVAMKVVELDSGDDLYALNSNKLMVPASTMKLISSATALELLGADYRFKTTVGYTGKIGKNGELNGDLIILGGADPALGSEYFQDHYMDFLQKWAGMVKDMGIKRIQGDLILDRSIYEIPHILSNILHLIF